MANHLSPEKQAQIIAAICEGMSIRATALLDRYEARVAA